MRYYVQFTAGTCTLMLEALDAQLSRLQVRYTDDSAVVVDSSSSPDIVAAVPFVKNAFVVIAETGRGDLDKGVLQMALVSRGRSNCQVAALRSAIGSPELGLLASATRTWAGRKCSKSPFG